MPAIVAAVIATIKSANYATVVSAFMSAYIAAIVPAIITAIASADDATVVAAVLSTYVATIVSAVDAAVKPALPTAHMSANVTAI